MQVRRDVGVDAQHAHLLRDEQSRKVLSKSPIGLAISYEQARWDNLRTHTGDGDLSIDNNVSERSLRAQAEHAGRVRCKEGSGIFGDSRYRGYLLRPPY
jgi:hypothetical protein